MYGVDFRYTRYIISTCRKRLLYGYKTTFPKSRIFKLLFKKITILLSRKEEYTLHGKLEVKNWDFLALTCINTFS